MALKGVQFTKEHKEKLRQSHIGKKLSIEHSLSISKSLKGRNITWGKKIGESNRAKGVLFKKGMVPWNKGKKGVNNPRRGSEHGQWKGGISKESCYFKRGKEYRDWVAFCKKRDNYTCVRCKQKKKKLNIHHIKNYSEFEELRVDVNNGVTFCKECHTEFHKKYGIKNNNKEQLDEFIMSFDNKSL